MPRPLPPDPPLRIDAAMHDRIERAGLALGRLAREGDGHALVEAMGASGKP